jgi:hypothetical protein
MSTNSLLTPTVIGKELLMRFKNNLGFIKTVDNQYDEKFDKIGDQYNLREGARFVANDGSDITSVIQDVNESSLPLKIDIVKNVAFSFSAKDLKLTVDRFGERYLEGAAVALANAYEVVCLTRAYVATSNLVGTPGTGINDMSVVLDAGVKLDNNAAPVSDADRFLTCNPASQGKAVKALSGLFQSANELGSQYRKGRMGHALGFDWGMSQNIRTHTNGAGTGYVVNGASQTGASIIVGTGTGALKAGTVVTFAGSNAVNPVSGDDLGYLKQFSIASDYTGGAGTITITEPIVTSGPTKNVTASPTTTGAVTVVSGSASTAYAQNLAYHRQAFAYAMVAPPEPMGVHMAKTTVDKDSGISIRFVSDYVIKTDEFITRADIWGGFVARRPTWACRISA